MLPIGWAAPHWSASVCVNGRMRSGWGSRDGATQLQSICRLVALVASATSLLNQHRKRNRAKWPHITPGWSRISTANHFNSEQLITSLRQKIAFSLPEVAVAMLAANTMRMETHLTAYENIGKTSLSLEMIQFEQTPLFKKSSLCRQSLKSQMQLCHISDTLNQSATLTRTP